MKHTKRPGQKADETAAEYLRRVVGNCNHEHENLLDDLPSCEAVLEFFELWSVYDTDLWDGVIESIAQGDSPEPALAFIRKWQLKGWSEEVRSAARIAKQEANRQTRRDRGSTSHERTSQEKDNSPPSPNRRNAG